MAPYGPLKLAERGGGLQKNIYPKQKCINVHRVYKEQVAIERVNVLGNITHEETRYSEDQITNGQAILTN